MGLAQDRRVGELERSSAAEQSLSDGISPGTPASDEVRHRERLVELTPITRRKGGLAKAELAEARRLGIGLLGSQNRSSLLVALSFFQDDPDSLDAVRQRMEELSRAGDIDIRGFALLILSYAGEVSLAKRLYEARPKTPEERAAFSYAETRAWGRLIMYSPDSAAVLPYVDKVFRDSLTNDPLRLTVLNALGTRYRDPRVWLFVGKLGCLAESHAVRARAADLLAAIEKEVYSPCVPAPPTVWPPEPDAGARPARPEPKQP
jgi:hypothetical protein